MTMQTGINPNPYYQHNNCTLYQGDVLDTSYFKESFFDLLVTSPPYNVGIEYNSNKDSSDYASYLEFSKQWIENCFFWAKDGARLCLNIPLDKNVVFDTFYGSGTTLLEAESNHRIGIGLELDRQYCELIEKRLKKDVKLFVV